jgi:hypothetical protein
MPEEISMDHARPLVIPTLTTDHYRIHLDRHAGAPSRPHATNRNKFQLGRFDPITNQLILDAHHISIGDAANHVLLWMSERFVESPNTLAVDVPLQAPQATLDRLETLRSDLHTAYKGRKAPFIHPSAWLTAPPPPPPGPIRQHPYHYRLMQQADVQESGFIIHLPPPPAPGGGGGGGGAVLTPLELFIRDHLPPTHHA